MVYSMEFTNILTYDMGCACFVTFKKKTNVQQFLICSRKKLWNACISTVYCHEVKIQTSIRIRIVRKIDVKLLTATSVLCKGNVDSTSGEEPCHSEGISSSKWCQVVIVTNWRQATDRQGPSLEKSPSNAFQRTSGVAYWFPKCRRAIQWALCVCFTNYP